MTQPAAGSASSGGVFEHPALDARWLPAEAIVERELASWPKDGSFTRIVVSPLTAPDGTQLEFLFAIDAYRGAKLENQDAVTIAAGHLVDARKATPADFAAFLHANNFPTKHVHPGLLLEAVAQFAIVAPTFLTANPGSAQRWTAIDKPVTSKHKVVELAYDATGATLAIYARAGGGYQPYGKDEADRATVRFDAAGQTTVHYDREQRDGTWVPLPKAP